MEHEKIQVPYFIMKKFINKFIVGSMINKLQRYKNFFKQ